MVRKIFVVILSIKLLNLQVEASTILCAFQLPYLSHHVQLRSVTEELVGRGHEVDVITTDPSYSKGDTPPNLTEVDLHHLTYNIWRKKMMKIDKNDSTSSQVQNTLDTLKDVIKSQFKSKEIQDIIKNGKAYELVVTDASSLSTLVYSYFFNIPLIAISTGSVISSKVKAIGIPKHAVYYPTMLTKNPYASKIYEKYEALYDDFALFNIDVIHEEKLYEELKREIFPELPTFSEISNKMDMILINIHPFWEGVRPYPQNSGLFKFNLKAEQAISQEFQAYLNTSKNGVIYASFGTSVSFSLLPKKSVDSILQAFSSLPLEVLLKCDKDELPGRPKNVKLFKFVSQPDILRHPKIKLFITQGGQHSIDEAIEAGVPMVVIPTKFDQFPNSERCVHHGIGVKLDLKTIDEQKLVDAVNTVVDNKRYRDNIVKLRSILRDNPMKYTERLMWSIEYLLHHGSAKHMRSPSANMSWTEFFELELFCYFLIFVIIILVLCIKLLTVVRKIVANFIGYRIYGNKFY